MSKTDELKFELLPRVFGSCRTQQDRTIFILKFLENCSPTLRYAVNENFEELHGTRYKNDIEPVEHRREKHTELKGDYVKKYHFS